MFDSECLSIWQGEVDKRRCILDVPTWNDIHLMPHSWPSELSTTARLCCVFFATVASSGMTPMRRRPMKRPVVYIGDPPCPLTGSQAPRAGIKAPLTSFAGPHCGTSDAAIADHSPRINGAALPVPDGTCNPGLTMRPGLFVDLGRSRRKEYAGIFSMAGDMRCAQALTVS